MTTATLISMALLLAVLMLWLAASRLSSYLPRLLDQVDVRQANRLLSGLLVVPLQLAALAVLLIVIWYGDELLVRLAHIGFVLGAFTAALLAGILFWLPWRARLDTSLPALIAVLIAIPLGVYFTPLANFNGSFAPDQLLLGGGTGLLAIVVYCLVLWSLRRAVLQRLPLGA